MESQLVTALSDGTTEGVADAKEKVKALGEENGGFIPTEQIATILGNAVGGGFEEGLQQVAQIPLPDDLAIYAELTGRACDR